MTISRGERIANYAILGFFALAVLYPLASIVLLSLHGMDDNVDGFSFPSPVTLESFVEAWREGGFNRGLVNSFVVAASVAVGTAILATLAGYAFGTMEFRGSSALFYLLLVGMIFPYEATVIPLFYIFDGMGLTDGYLALILPQIALSVPFGTFWMRAYFRTTPRAMTEAGRLDGASTFQTLRSVLLPNARPALTTLIVLVFMWTWNEFLLALVMIQSDELRTAPLGLAVFSGANRGIEPTVVAAAAVLVALPVALVYLALQRSFIRGMFAGSVNE